MGPEQRRFARTDLSLPMTFRRKAGLAGGWVLGTIRDFSAGGLCFEAGELLEPGAAIELRLELPIRRNPYLFDGRILWERPQPGQASEYGAAFVNVSGGQQSELDAIVEFVSRPGA